MDCFPFTRAIPISLISLGLISLGTLVAAPRPRVAPRKPSVNNQQLRVQVLLDRAHFSPGEIDGAPGRVTRTALEDFRKSGRTLDEDPSVQTLVAYTITEDDVKGPFEKIPEDLMDQAKLDHLGYQSAIEGLGEKFHSSPKLLQRLNPGKDLSKAGETIQVPNVRQDAAAEKATSVVVSKSRLTVQALEQAGKIIAEYPATVGSIHDPLPIGKWKVVHVTRDPIFYYNPNLFWDAPSSDTKAKIQPGPNNPSGVVWIGITKEHYGIHGTPEPSLIGHVQSHGCIRMTNWDAAELAGMVGAGTPVVFKE